MLGVWLTPATTMKMRREHLVPLSTQALEVLRKMKERSRGSVYVFAADHRLDRYISENAVLALIARMGYRHTTTASGAFSPCFAFPNFGYPRINRISFPMM